MKLICSDCGFEIHPNHSGVRHFGTHSAHNYSECLWLLTEQITMLKTVAQKAKELIRDAEVDPIDYAQALRDALIIAGVLDGA